VLFCGVCQTLNYAFCTLKLCFFFFWVRYEEISNLFTLFSFGHACLVKMYLSLIC
jgi:hypothetical protein